MEKIVFKAHVPPGSLISKLAAHVAPIFVNPKFDSTTNCFVVGDRKIQGKRSNPTDSQSEIVAEVPGCDVILSDQSFGFPIHHDMILDRNSPHDMFIYELSLAAGVVAPSRAEFNSTAGHRFFVLDEEKEAVGKSSKADKTFEAMSVIREMRSEEKRDLARLLGEYVLKMSDTRIDGFLKNLTMSDPEKIIFAVADKDYKYRVFLKKLLNANIILHTSGKYVYGNDLIGVDEDHLVTFLRDPQNASLVTEWGRLLNKDVVMDVAGDVIEGPKRGRRPNVVKD